MYCTLIYYGKEMQLIHLPRYNHTTRVVLTLINPLTHQGYDLFVDRFYSSPELALALMSQGIRVMGTVMQNRRNMPLDVRGKQKRGDMDAYKKNKIVAVRSTDKRTPLMLSTKYTNEVVDVQSRYIKARVKLNTYVYT